MAYGSKGKKIFDYQQQMRGGGETVVFTGTLQLGEDSAQMLRLDSGAGPEEVRMPASDRDGVWFEIMNVGSQALLLRDSAGAPLGLGASSTLGVGQACKVYCEGGTWTHLGIYAITL
jgi:hypothetical protein